MTSQDCYGTTQTWTPGARIRWDDRHGWEGDVVACNPDGTLTVRYDNGESDAAMPPRMLALTPGA